MSHPYINSRCSTTLSSSIAPNPTPPLLPFPHRPNQCTIPHVVAPPLCIPPSPRAFCHRPQPLYSTTFRCFPAACPAVALPPQLSLYTGSRGLSAVLSAVVPSFPPPPPGNCLLLLYINVPGSPAVFSDANHPLVLLFLPSPPAAPSSRTASTDVAQMLCLVPSLVASHLHCNKSRFFPAS